MAIIAVHWHTKYRPNKRETEECEIFSRNTYMYRFVHDSHIIA